MKERKELNIHIGERIRQAREKTGYTQERLADKIDVSVQYVSDLERGVVGTSIPTLIKICHSLSVSSDFILMGHNADIEPLDISIRLKSLSLQERKLMEENINLMLEAFRINQSETDKSSEKV